MAHTHTPSVLYSTLPPHCITEPTPELHPATFALPQVLETHTTLLAETEKGLFTFVVVVFRVVFSVTPQR